MLFTSRIHDTHPESDLTPSPHPFVVQANTASSLSSIHPPANSMAKTKSKLPVVNRGYATVSVMKAVEPEVETETSTTATTTTATEPGSGQTGIETPDGVKGRGKKEKRKGKRGQPSGQDEEETTSTLTPREETLLREISVAKHRADKRIESQQGLVQHTTDEAILRWDGTTVDGSRVVDVAGDMPLANDLWIATATDGR
jgi:hypothetical protein